MMIFRRVIIHFIITLLTMKYRADADEYSTGADYLQNAIRDIVEINSDRNSNILSLIDNHQARIVTSPSKTRLLAVKNSMLFDGNRRLSSGEYQHPQPQSQQATVHHHTYQHDYFQPEPAVQQAQLQAQVSPAVGGIPDPPSLTKGELAALYEAAVSAGHSVHMAGPTAAGGVHDQLPVQAALHEIRDSVPAQATDGESYYYYYYPLKSFLDGIPTQIPKSNHVPKGHYQTTPIVTSYNTHLHNVKVEPLYPEHKGIKAMEPLFMAISSFVGMAMMFLFSTVVLPRLTGGIKKVIKGGKGVGGDKNTNGGPKPKTKITILSRNNNRNNKNSNNKNKNKNYRENNFRNNNSNKMNNKKKPRFFDGYVDWRHLITNFGKMDECTTCEDHTLLHPYNGLLSRNEEDRSRN